MFFRCQIFEQLVGSWPQIADTASQCKYSSRITTGKVYCQSKRGWMDSGNDHILRQREAGGEDPRIYEIYQ